MGDSFQSIDKPTTQDRESGTSRDSLQSDHEHKPHQPAKPKQHLPEIHLHSHKLPDHHKIPPKHHTQPTSNENQKPSDEDNNELEPAMILGGAGSAPPPGGEEYFRPNSDPDHCTVEEWFKNTVTVIKPEGKDQRREH